MSRYPASGNSKRSSETRYLRLSEKGFGPNMNTFCHLITTTLHSRTPERSLGSFVVTEGNAAPNSLFDAAVAERSTQATLPGVARANGMLFPTPLASAYVNRHTRHACEGNRSPCDHNTLLTSMPTTSSFHKSAKLRRAYIMPLGTKRESMFKSMNYGRLILPQPFYFFQ